MKNFCAKISVLSALLSAALFSACNSQTTPNPDVPVGIVCVLNYTGSIYSPIRSSEPFIYSLYDINGKFVAYLDSSRVVMARPESMINKCVFVRGHLIKMDGNDVLRADMIRLQR